MRAQSKKESNNDSKRKGDSFESDLRVNEAIISSKRQKFSEKVNKSTTEEVKQDIVNSKTGNGVRPTTLSYEEMI